MRERRGGEGGSGMGFPSGSGFSVCWCARVSSESFANIGKTKRLLKRLPGPLSVSLLFW